LRVNRKGQRKTRLSGFCSTVLQIYDYLPNDVTTERSKFPAVAGGVTAATRATLGTTAEGVVATAFVTVAVAAATSPDCPAPVFAGDFDSLLLFKLATF
jgi:hypothetical protein